MVRSRCGVLVLLPWFRAAAPRRCCCWAGGRQRAPSRVYSAALLRVRRCGQEEEPPPRVRHVPFVVPISRARTRPPPRARHGAAGRPALSRNSSSRARLCRRSPPPAPSLTSSPRRSRRRDERALPRLRTGRKGGFRAPPHPHGAPRNNPAPRARASPTSHSHAHPPETVRHGARQGGHQRLRAHRCAPAPPSLDVRLRHAAAAACAPPAAASTAAAWRAARLLRLWRAAMRAFAPRRRALTRRTLGCGPARPPRAAPGVREAGGV